MSEPSIQPGTNRHIHLWIGLAVGTLGLVLGLGLFTLDYAEGTSYLSSDAETCVNCHIMREQYDGWNHSSHKAVANCVDCHLPHDFIGKWAIKGLNGLRHSYYFTTGHFEEPIRITQFDADIVQENCVRCHTTVTSMIITDPEGEAVRCVACHGNVGHGGR